MGFLSPSEIKFKITDIKEFAKKHRYPVIITTIFWFVLWGFWKPLIALYYDGKEIDTCINRNRTLTDLHNLYIICQETETIVQNNSDTINQLSEKYRIEGHKKYQDNISKIESYTKSIEEMQIIDFKSITSNIVIKQKLREIKTSIDSIFNLSHVE